MKRVVYVVEVDGVPVHVRLTQAGAEAGRDYSWPVGKIIRYVPAAKKRRKK